MSNTYNNGPGNVPRLPDRVVDTLIDSAGVSRCAPGRGITVIDQTAAIEALVHGVCEELLARLPDASLAAPVANAEELGRLVALAEAARDWVSPEAWEENRNYSDHEVRGLEFSAAANPAAILRIAALVAQQAARLESRAAEGGSDKPLTIVEAKAEAAAPEAPDDAQGTPYFRDVEFDPPSGLFTTITSLGHGIGSDK